jgi:hypothetical protein
MLMAILRVIYNQSLGDLGVMQVTAQLPWPKLTSESPTGFALPSHIWVTLMIHTVHDDVAFYDCAVSQAHVDQGRVSSLCKVVVLSPHYIRQSFSLSYPSNLITLSF